MYALTFVIGSASLPAETTTPDSSNAIRSSPVIYLTEDDKFAKLDLLEFAQPDASTGTNFYMRNRQLGRYLRLDEKQHLVSPEFFDRIYGSSPFLSSLRSLVAFDRSAQNTLYKTPTESSDLNFRTRILKIGLLGLTGFLYANATSKLKSDRYAIRNVNNHTADHRYLAARNSFYGIGAMTLGYHLLTAIQAFRNFGMTDDGIDLRIPKRVETDGTSILSVSVESSGRRIEPEIGRDACGRPSRAEQFTFAWSTEF